MCAGGGGGVAGGAAVGVGVGVVDVAAVVGVVVVGGAAGTAVAAAGLGAGGAAGVTGISLKVLKPSSVSVLILLVAPGRGAVLIAGGSSILSLIPADSFLGPLNKLLVTSVKDGLFTLGGPASKSILSKLLISSRLMSAFGEEDLDLF